MKPISRSGTLAIACGIFLALGLLVAALGPALPDLAQNAGSTLAALGAVYTALFSGAFLAQLVVGPLSDRLGQRPLVVAGMVLIGAGMFGISLSGSLTLTLACAAVAGLGHGTLIVVMHVLIAQLFSTGSVSALNLINVFFGVGAVSGPALAGLALQRWETALPVLWFGGGLLLAQLALVPLMATGSLPARAAGVAPQQIQIYKIPALWLLGILLFVYIGLESGVGGWTTAYLERSAGLTKASAAWAASGFWLALTGGRVAGAIIGTRMPPTRLLQISVAGSLAGGLAFALGSGNGPISIGAILLMGFCFGPVFPTTVSLTTASFPQAQGSATSLVVAIGNTGGIVLPWLLGFLLERSPQASALLVLACAIALAAILALYTLLRSHRPTAQPNVA
ncbi:MAG: MFS transporter [Herpetosiphonaceae bacterium]|nr:MFS transporter [Herpetosiphonaceae bacterium]